MAKLAKDDVDGALADWKKFVQAQGKKLGKPGIERVGHWLVRSAVLEPVSEIADPADRVRFAREQTSAASSTARATRDIGTVVMDGPRARNARS